MGASAFPVEVFQYRKVVYNSGKGNPPASAGDCAGWERQIMEEGASPKAPSSRERFRDYMAGRPVDRPPMFESQFPDDTVAAWSRQGLPAETRPEQYFGLDERERVPIRTSRVDLGVKPVTDMRAARIAAGRYFSDILRQYPPDWPRVRESIQDSRKVIYADIYPRGLFQEMGVKDSPTLHSVLMGLHDEPKAAELLMGRYTDFLVEVVHNRYHGLEIEYFLYSEPIAHPTAPVISPEMYRRFVLPHLARLVHEGRRIGVHEHVISTTGEVRPLIPLWLEAGINGLSIGHAAALGIDYLQLRREHGAHVSLWGGVDNRALYAGPEAVDAEVARIAPLLSSGRYIPMLDDTVRPEAPFDAYAHYRKRIEAAVRG